MIAKAAQLPCKQIMSARDDQAARLFRIGNVVYFESAPLLDLTEGCFQERVERTKSRAFVFLLAMAAISMVRELGGGWLGNALFAWSGVTFDPFILAGALHPVVTLVGIGVACCFSKRALGLAARRHLLLTLLAAMGIGLILVWLSYLVGCSNVRGWPLALIYLLWAWVAAASSA